jgi:hypothetical protein
MKRFANVTDSDVGEDGSFIIGSSVTGGLGDCYFFESLRIY